MRRFVSAAIALFFVAPAFAEDASLPNGKPSVREHHLSKVCLNLKSEPRFSDFPADATGLRVPKLQIAPNAYFKEKDALEYAVGKKANFAGHYYLAEFGCGTMCMTSILIDLERGKRVSLDPDKPYAIGATGPMEYYPNSRLVKVDMRDAHSPEGIEEYWTAQNSIEGTVIPEFYILENGAFWKLETPCDKTQDPPPATK